MIENNLASEDNRNNAFLGSSRVLIAIASRNSVPSFLSFLVPLVALLAYRGLLSWWAMMPPKVIACPQNRKRANVS